MGKILSRFEENNLRIVATKMIHMTRLEAEGFYAVHRERPFFSELTQFMSSGPVVVSILEGENAVSHHREIMGATNPAVKQQKEQLDVSMQRVWVKIQSMAQTVLKTRLLKLRTSFHRQRE